MPMDFGGPNDTLVVQVFGTGTCEVSSLTKVVAQIGSKFAPVPFARPQGQIEGLDHVKFDVPRGAGRRWRSTHYSHRGWYCRLRQYHEHPVTTRSHLSGFADADVVR